ncbi:MAG: response regulator [Burkholderiales bacterium]|nr:response regulator [Burkholderiales bacterium]PZN01732.1 MAG: DNA-binding response regulator [Pseudomonadota bacterium]
MVNETRRGIVLVVDDVPENLAVLCDTLDEAGYIVTVATDGPSALQRLQHVTPDAILLDAVMPGWDGFETCARIKADPRWSHIPVLFMTGLTETEHVIKGFKVGGVDYVTKPLNPAVVVARVDAHIATAHMIGQAREVADLAGHAVVVLRKDLSLSWCTRRARNWLQEYVPGALGEETRWPPALREWLAQAIPGGNASSPAPYHIKRESRTLTLHVLGQVEANQYVLMLQERADAQAATASYNLTQRELEVLTWLAKGKTNRDIAEILGMSPRTVNKHLEHIYVKLGVETRTAAAAIARERAVTS